MSKNFTVLVGSLGMGLWRSHDGGMTWARSKLWKGYQGGRSVYGLAVDPRDPRVIWAGADDGIYRSEDRGDNFEHVDSPMDQYRVWRVAIDPVEPSTMFAGTGPAALFRSRDSGRHWEKLNAEFAAECPNVSEPRVLGLSVDPSDHRTIWSGVEVDYVRVSRDGGDTWERLSGGYLDEPDIHDTRAIPGKPGHALVVLPNEITVTADGGRTWRGLDVGRQFPPSQPYCRSVAFKEDDPDTIFAAVGDNALGCQGTIMRSTDGGHTWDQPYLPFTPNTHMEWFATHPADPNLIVASTHYGQLFATSDGGDWWTKLPREFTEVRGAVAWVPN